MKADISAAQQKISQIAGRPPQFFRPTAGLRNPMLDPVLSRLDLKLASWTRRPYDTYEGDVQRIYDRLVENLAPGDILLLHDGHSARTPSGEPVILAVLPRLLQKISELRLNPVTLRRPDMTSEKIPSLRARQTIFRLHFPRVAQARHLPDQSAFP
jgi:peptidoglycan/xylan/chitin deacetylase (PgdA/CDA1 family)